ncbi:hypothetical protein JT739_04775 [Tepidanaerobacter sp. GT38]|uniref:hypothetical protein n=1 Tax=Tepidanaerobacter sp. GT38 TaxID=2722793 RepID=UPI001F1B16F1|nr:hypothetical protein [Tepidanaerobacter sp. GT38]MCG1011912.1 hypothetical protein [Tepidanaerobacter sp. GT38]
MKDQFTYISLGTLTGAVTATILVVEFIKEIKYFKPLPTKWLVFMISVVIVIFTSIARGEFRVINLPLYFLNGLLVTTSAMGSWRVINDSMGSIKAKSMKEKN